MLSRFNKGFTSNADRMLSCLPIALQPEPSSWNSQEVDASDPQWGLWARCSTRQYFRFQIKVQAMVTCMYPSLQWLMGSIG